MIKFYGPKFESDWRVAFEALNEKLNTRATPVASARFDEPKLAATIAAVPPSARHPKPYPCLNPNPHPC